MSYMKKGGLFGYNFLKPQDKDIDAAVVRLNTAIKASSTNLNDLATISAKPVVGRTPDEVAKRLSLKKALADGLKTIAKESANVNARFTTNGGKSKKSRGKKSKTLKKR